MMRPALVELCRLRIAQIVRGSDAALIDPSEAGAAGVTSAQLAELATWYTSDRFDATERACLQLAEYFCYSAQSVTDEIVAEVSANLTAEQVLALTNAIWVSDSSQRLHNFLESVGAGETTP
jgi:alkylhydroperoxidase family enzyme